MLKLNLGCSTDIKSGYQNIDIFDHPLVTKMDIRNLKYKDGEVDEVFAKDVLEHLPYKDSLNCLNEWARVLKPGGKIFIQTIDLDLFLKAYLDGIWDVDVVNHMLFAGINWRGDAPTEYDFHKSIFTSDKICSVLEKNNVKIIEIKKDILHDLNDNKYAHNLNMFITGVKI